MTTTRVVAAVDGSPQSSRALAFAVEEAELRGVALSVVIARPTLSARWSGDARLTPEVTAEQAAELRSVVDGMLADLERERGRASGAQASVELLNGPPAEIIDDYLQPTDLLVVGSRGVGGIRRLLLGSVSSALVHTARCPVVVVRPAPGKDGGEA